MLSITKLKKYLKKYSLFYYMTTFYLVRHGLTQSNLDGRYSGQTNEELTDEGRAQAKYLAELLKDKPFDIIYHSKLIRSEHTALEIAVYHNDKGPTADPRINELNMGTFDGRLPSEVNSDDYAARLEDKFGFQIPGGESYKMLIERLNPFVRDVREKFPSGHVCIVGHQGVNRGLMYIILGEDVISQDRMTQLEIPHDAYIEIKEEPEVLVRMVSDKRYSEDIF